MRELTVPPIINTVLSEGGALAISLSAGKDSQALGEAIMAEREARGWDGPVFAVHAHLGRAEWPQTKAHCHYLANRWGVSLEIVSHGDLIDRMKARMHKLEGTGAPFWPSSTTRYCTSDMKRGPIDKLLRQYELVVSAEGIRGQESSGRRKKPTVHTRNQITAKALRQATKREPGISTEAAFAMWKPGQRLALTWNAVHDWTVDDVWETCGHSLADLQRRRELFKAGQTKEALADWLAHPAYVFGNERLSCMFCILASRNDLCNGAHHNPELLAELVQMERESGFTFRQDLSLASLEAA